MLRTSRNQDTVECRQLRCDVRLRVNQAWWSFEPPLIQPNSDCIEQNRCTSCEHQCQREEHQRWKYNANGNDAKAHHDRQQSSENPPDWRSWYGVPTVTLISTMLHPLVALPRVGVAVTSILVVLPLLLTYKAFDSNVTHGLHTHGPQRVPSIDRCAATSAFAYGFDQSSGDQPRPMNIEL